nr:hypothetical protein [Tanacetum cinerariifolium]
MSTIIQGIASSGINGCISHTSSISETKTRMWDVSAVTGRYLSTDFVMSDAKGNMIHCSAKATASHNFLRLKEGSIYSVKNFVVKPNKDEYRLLKNDAYMLEFDRSTTIRKALVKAGGFMRYPFQLQDFDGIESLDNKYLIDVVGYVTHVRRTNHLKLGSKNLDFYLANHRGQSIRVKLWGSLGDVLIEKNQTDWYRLKVDMLDDTTQAVVVVFNETATALINYSADSLMDIADESSEDHLSLLPALSDLIGTAHVMEIKSHTYYEYGTFESFTCWQIFPLKGIEDSVRSNNLDDYPDNQPQKLKRTVRDPSIVTSSKPIEERKKGKDSESEDSSDSANGTWKKGAVEPSTKKGKTEPCMTRLTQHKGPKIIKLDAAAAR